MEKEKGQICGPEESGKGAEVDKMVKIWFEQLYEGVMRLKKYVYLNPFLPPIRSWLL